MPFGNKALPSRRWKYGALDPEAVCLTGVLEQLHLAHRYRNALVELELGRRERIAQARAQHYPELLVLEGRLADLDRQILSVREEIKRSHVQQQSRHHGTPAQQEQLRTLKQEKAPLFARHKEVRSQAREDQQLLAAWALVEAETQGARKHLYNGEFNGLYWGTKNAIAESIPHSGPPPRFHRFDGTGRLVVQIQATRPLSGLDLLDQDDNRAHVERLQQYFDRPQTKLALLTMQIGGGLLPAAAGAGKRKRSPLLQARVPFVLHRPLPEQAQVKSVELIRTRVATRYRWSVQFVLAQETWPDKPLAGSGECGVDVGWRSAATTCAWPYCAAGMAASRKSSFPAGKSSTG